MISGLIGKEEESSRTGPPPDDTSGLCLELGVSVTYCFALMVKKESM